MSAEETLRSARDRHPHRHWRNPRSGVRRVLAGGLLISAAGLVPGIAGAAALARFIAGLVFEISPLDPAALALVAAVLTLASAAALLAVGASSSRRTRAITSWPGAMAARPTAFLAIGR